MRRIASLLLLPVSFGLLACDSSTAPEAGITALPAGSVPELSMEGLSSTDRAAMQLFNESRDTGAFVVKNCLIVSPGFFTESGSFIGFGGLFANELFEGGTCGFTRTNPDGSEDLHVNGRGGLFLFLFQPFAIYGSTGSNVKWTFIRHADGIGVLTFTGTLSNGSRVRGHFTSGDNSAGSLWVEDLGYVLGSPGKSGR